MLILASQSPRRAELLRQVGIPFRAISATVDEATRPDEVPPDYVRRLAFAKARTVHARFPEAPVIGSDTAVVLDQRILGKPPDRGAAIEMLLALSGRTHEVLTAVALVAPGGREHYALCASQVSFRALSADEAAAYWATGEPVDKAGGYAIQGIGATFVRHITGSYSGVMGLPIYETLDLLRNVGVHGPIQPADAV